MKEADENLLAELNTLMKRFEKEIMGLFDEILAVLSDKKHTKAESFAVLQFSFVSVIVCAVVNKRINVEDAQSMLDLIKISASEAGKKEG